MALDTKKTKQFLRERPRENGRWEYWEPESTFPNWHPKIADKTVLYSP